MSTENKTTPITDDEAAGVAGGNAAVCSICNQDLSDYCTEAKIRHYAACSEPLYRLPTNKLLY